MVRFRGRKRILLAAAGCAVVAAAGLFAYPMDADRYLEVEASSEMVDRSGRLMYAFLNRGQQWCFERGLDGISPRLIEATIAVEDQRYYSHPGVDPVAIVRAAWQNLTQGRTVSGASTLTMQVVKSAGRAPRTLWGKTRQAVQALRLERWRGKRAILRAYLNNAPYGLNLVGAEAASRRYYGKPARELTLPEAALLAGLPKSPTALMPLKHAGRARHRRDYVLARMREEGFTSEAECSRASAAPLGVSWHAFPKLSPHLAMRLKPAIQKQGRLRVTLDAGTQSAAERLIAHGLERYRDEIGNAAAIVIHAPSSSILARVGSAGFFKVSAGGQFDACRARRSPGSALKPFTYALAMERNVLYASEMLLDGAVDYGVYSPDNYDGEFNGVIPAADALQYSLNVPAVLVLERLGVETLQTFLADVGLTTLEHSPGGYGLGLTLGNCEVRLEELAAAYCMLANLGTWRPLRVVDEPWDDEARRCLSRGTCLKIFEMLDRPLPGETDAGLIRATNPARRVCWKTGTSTGHFDAWAFVFNARYVVGVWMGNNDGASSNRLVGVESAVPIAARLFRSLEPANACDWPGHGADLRPVKICATSGLPASKWCQRTREETFPRGQYLNRVCDMHHPAPGSRGAVIERRPGSAKGWDLANIRGTAAGKRRQNLRILEPANRAEYVLTGEDGGDRIRMRTSLDGEAVLYWYTDDLYLGASAPGNPLALSLTPGSHTLACVTADGTLDCVTFEVAHPGPTVRFGRGVES